MERPKTPFDNLLEDLEGIVKDNSKLGTLVGSPRGHAKIDIDFSSNPNAHLFENIYAIQEEEDSRSRESIEEEEKHEDLDEGGPGIYEKDSLGSYNSEEAKEEEPDEEMDFDDVD